MAEYEGVMFGQGKGLFLCDHNYKVLKNLQNTRVGDKIIIETVYGANYEYKITCSEKALLVQPNDSFKGIKKLNSDGYLQEIYEDRDVLGILICWSSASNNYRWYVGATLVRGTEEV